MCPRGQDSVRGTNVVEVNLHKGFTLHHYETTADCIDQVQRVIGHTIDTVT